MIRASLLGASAAAIALAAPAMAQDFAITNATVATGDGSAPIANATVVVRGGKIAAVGADVRPDPSLPTIDGTGRWVTPGLVAAVTTLGLVDVTGVESSNDTIASRARFNAALDVTPAINPASQHVKVGRANGITRAVVSGGASNSIFAGQGAVIDLGDDPSPVTKAKAFQMVTLSESGARIAGGSRKASHAELRNAFREAQDFAAGRWSGDGNLLTRADAEALGPVVAGTQQLFIEAHRASDIRTAIALSKEFPRLRLVLVGATEGWLVAQELAASGIPVMAESLQDLPERFEQIAATQSNIGRMRAAGVNVSINADSIRFTDHLKQHAGNLVALGRMPGAAGLSWGEALATISSRPAEAVGMGGKIGVLKPGAAGDVVIWDGDPLEVSSGAVQVFIDGVEQPLDNHRTRLRDRYRDLDESDLPKAFDW
ncbi:MAG TPA: amidohydrolase family protein [Erythrobacter sp.]|nr:amidohydrolase family protein [Erythrobacter sp.]